MTRNNLWTAILNSQSPRHADWQAIFGSDLVPLVSPSRYSANFGNEEFNVEIYKLDIAALDAGQRERLVNYVAAKFSVMPAEVERQLDNQGFPIREADVNVAFSYRGLL